MSRNPLVAAGLSFCLGVSLASCASEQNEVAASVQAQSADESDREAWAASQGLVIKKYDLNRDQRPDIFKFYRLVDDPRNPGNKLEQLVRKEMDINRDGRIDVTFLYDDQQRVVEERADLDFDGRIDEVIYWNKGALDRKEYDLDYDGKADVTKYYIGDKLARIESDRNKDDKVDTWEYYEGDTLDRIGTDSDLDGVADTWERRKQSSEGGADPGAAATSGGAEGADDGTQTQEPEPEPEADKPAAP